MNKRTVFLICLGIGLLPVIYLAIIWKDIPATIPTHWGLENVPDAYGDKSNLIYMLLIPVIMTPLLALLMLNLDKIDPKKGKNIPAVMRNKLALSISIFMTAIAAYMLYITKSETHKMGNTIFLLLGLFFAFLGNIMYSIKQNYFVGIRLPWTLENEENWNRTNRIMSILFFISGIVIAIAALVLPSIPVMIITFGSIFASVIYSIVFSYRLYRKQQAGKV